MAGGSTSWDQAITYRLLLVEACKKLDFDAVVALSDYSLTTKDYQPRYVDKDRYVDHWGRVMQANPRSRTTFFVDGVVKTPEDLESYEPPNAFHPDIYEMMEHIMRSVRGRGYCRDRAMS